MPPVLADESEWPAQLKFLVREYGAEKVYAAGMRRLRYPPTIVDLLSEAEAVLNELEKQ